KALIMGLLVLRLQEHRMDQRENGADFNEGLKHVTILEEAHNLLKRTSTEQSNESANLLGKSVEMLANSIAEMRTYGEGFIIADQSPGMLDLSVIRNTNTKIIMRLPDFSDRELVGKAAGLNNEQIEELVKLEQGVAAISQNNWVEPILCKIDKYEDNSTDSHSITDGYNDPDSIDTKKVSKSVLDCIMTKELYRKGDRVDIQKLRMAVLRAKLDTNVKCKFIDYIESGNEEAVNSLRSLIYEFLNADKAVEESKHCDDIIGWAHSVAEKLSPEIKDYSSEQINLVMTLLVDELSYRNAEYNDILCRFAEVYRQNGGIF
ncbi:ATP-binding protein, partial [Oribacterium sp. FC2011]|uniref:ATP-binding protein n=1 Tax=Oribacterium sp. FC2011 TaxID=1408311 RepID=UPI0004E21388